MKLALSMGGGTDRIEQSECECERGKDSYRLLIFQITKSINH